ncbi:E3 ubiquitin-protein ligase tom1, partial [Cryomyces antarcticus]
MLSHSNGAFDRLLRNLIDSPQLLNALRKVIDNAPIFGSNVWSGAVNILSSFIHNEPTSYQVIAEAGLSRSVLEAVTQTSIPEFDSALKPISTSVKPRLAQGILPIAETIQTVPHAFGAICLNESGMKLFQASGALEKFFEVFQSPAHVRALNDDQDAPTVLGSSFDELVRHHPPLKDIVLRSVMNMASKVALLSFNQASEKGAGAALWVETKEGKLLVAGGRKALSGHEPPHTARYEKLSERQLKEAHARANGTDVEMQDVLAPTNAGPSQSNSDFSFDDFLNLNPADGSGNREAAEDYVSVACRFLIGFFSNSSMCAAFCESGGIDILLNFATLPSYECNFYQLPVYDEIAKVIQQMVEQKPHLTLPSLIKRTQYAVDLLEPVVNHDKDFAYFSIFTDRSYSPPPDCLDWFEDVKSKGTLTVKSLTI